MRGCSCRGTAGFVHVSCLAEQAKILVAEADENNKDSQWHRWYKCSLCEQDYHGVVACALGWACWKTYLGRPETDEARRFAMNVLGVGLDAAKHYEDAMTVQEAELSMARRLGESEDAILSVQGSLAITYEALGRKEHALSMQRDVYSGYLRLKCEEDKDTLLEANNYAADLIDLKRFVEARSLLRQTIPVAQRVLGEGHDISLRLRWTYTQSLYLDPGATLDDLHEAVTTLVDIKRTARRVLGGAHPTTEGIETLSLIHI